MFSNLKKFTFHYVSINTKMPMKKTFEKINLHSTMFLLIQKTVMKYMGLNFIYIPLCFY